MGKLFGQLTNPGVSDPNSGQTQFFNPGQVQSGAMAKALTPQPGSLQPQDTVNQGNAPRMPQTARPSFLQASQMGESTPGAGNALSPGLTKAGKLVTLLTGGLKGAMAGEASSANAVLQSGGRRGGNVGTGFEAGVSMPWERAMQGQQLQQAQAQTALTKAQADMIPTPFGMMPAALARYILPASIREQGTLGAAQIGAQGRIGAAQVNQRFKVVPNIGLFDTQGGGGQGAVVPGTAQGITVTPEIAQDYGLPQDYVGRPMALTQFASIERARNQGITTIQGSQGPALVDKAAALQGRPGGAPRNLGVGSPAMAGVVPVAADPNNPGSITYTPKTEAVGQGMASPQSAPSQAAKSTLKSATAGPMGAQINAFNTALQHADLLQQSLTALGNGDVRTLNSLKNRFKTEFGSADVTNFQTIASAYTREITKMLAAGHMTDAEIGSAGASLPSKASPQQILGALSAYRALARSKMQQLQGQVNSGMQGKPNFPANLGGTPQGQATHIWTPQGLQPAR